MKKLRRLYKKISLLIIKMKLKNLSVINKLLLYSILFFLLMIFLSVSNFKKYSYDKEKDIKDIILKQNTQLISEIDNYIQDIESLTKFPLSEITANNEFLNLLEQYNLDNIEIPEFQKASERMMYDVFSLKEQIHSVFFFNTSGYGEYKIRNNTLREPFNPKDLKWFSKSINNYGKPVVIGTFLLPNVSEISLNPVYVFSVARGLVRFESAKVIGVILINTNINYLSNLCKKILLYKNQRIIIVDADGNTVYDTIEFNITHKASHQILNLMQRNALSKYVTIGSDNYLYDVLSTSMTDWKVISLVPVAEINRNISKMKSDTALLTTIIILFAIFFTIIIARQIAFPLRKLVLLIKLINKGDLHTKIGISGHDEIGILAKNFNHMTRSLKKMINEKYIDEIKKKDLELQMLQYQINPHFLYNTLESISMMALINNDERTSDMATALGDILRYGISKQIFKVTVEEEIKHLEDYIMLQEIRFKQLFMIRVNVDRSIYSCIIIKFILQPIVENAIYHGLSDSTENGQINVTGYEDGANIVFEVRDNGVGMIEEKVINLNDYINGLNNSFNSIGLKNVHKRIILYYGNNYGITIQSNFNEGTTVRITLPKIGKNEIR